MKKLFLAGVLCVFSSTFAAAGGLEDFLSNLNIQARADMNGFSAKISAQFGTPDVQVRAVLSTVSDPADAFMVFQLGHMTQTPPEKVLRVYKSNKGRGWGVIAKELGIKPGSAEFHALKRGDFQFGSSDNDGPGKGKGKGHGKGKHDRE
jgi:hypothetical protein